MVGDPARPDLGRRSRVGGDGDLEVFVADEQAQVPVDTARWGRLAEGVLLAEGVRGHAELSLLFVSDDDIAVLNEEFLGTPGPTDVLAFPIDGELVEVDDGPGPHRRGPDRPPADPGDLPLLLGDVVVCPSVAAARRPTTPARWTTSWRCWWSTGCCTCSDTTTPRPMSGPACGPRARPAAGPSLERAAPAGFGRTDPG